MAYPNDLARTKNWGTEVLTDADLEGQLDLIINWLMAVMDTVTGHKHDATANEGPKITSAGILDDNVLFAALDDDGDYGLFTGDWSFNEIALVEDDAPSTDEGEMKLYTKDTDGQPELFAREESDGDEVQITSGGALALPAGSISMWGGAIASPPSGWLICDGSEISTTTYAALYAVIAHKYAADPGGGNFTLPNFSNRFPYGANEGAAAGNASVGKAGIGDDVTLAANDNDVTLKHGHGTSEEFATGGGAHPYKVVSDVMPPYLAVAFMIKT